LGPNCQEPLNEDRPWNCSLFADVFLVKCLKVWLRRTHSVRFRFVSTTCKRLCTNKDKLVWRKQA
jgi:hypothetical protein